MEFDRVVPAAGSLTVCHRQFWMGTHRVGMVVRILEPSFDRPILRQVSAIC
ncbi:MAG: hypothetical protein QOE03_9 [Micromonosporaceae bacterium]|nr:hypothetical protein [Micromonosporaceae bacterium]